MVPLAHVGHWLVDVLYLAPLVALAVAVAVGKLRERRRPEGSSRRLAPIDPSPGTERPTTPG